MISASFPDLIGAGLIAPVSTTAIGLMGFLGRPETLGFEGDDLKTERWWACMFLVAATWISYGLSVLLFARYLAFWQPVVIVSFTFVLVLSGIAGYYLARPDDGVARVSRDKRWGMTCVFAGVFVLCDIGWTAYARRNNYFVYDADFPIGKAELLLDGGPLQEYPLTFSYIIIDRALRAEHDLQLRLTGQDGMLCSFSTNWAKPAPAGAPWLSGRFFKEDCQ